MHPVPSGIIRREACKCIEDKVGERVTETRTAEFYQVASTDQQQQQRT